VCTILVLHRLHPEWPVVVAANRDEFFARTARPPAERGRAADGTAIVAGTDVKQGGTWLGVTGGGTFAAITNQRDWDPPAPRPESRGQIVHDALAAGSPAAIDAHLEGLVPGKTLPFNLLYGDAERLTVAYGRDDGIERVELAPGIHVLANDRIGAPTMPKTAWLAERVAPLVELPWAELRPALESILGDDTVPPAEAVAAPPPGARFGADLVRRLQALCIRTPEYGTVSASLLALSPNGVGEYRYADGPPADVPFVDVPVPGVAG